MKSLTLSDLNKARNSFSSGLGWLSSAELQSDRDMYGEQIKPLLEEARKFCASFENVRSSIEAAESTE